MSTTPVATRSDVPLARIALGTGILALIVWFGLAFAVSDTFFIVGLVLGVIGVALGVAARKRARSSTATAAILLSAIPVVWFILYMIVAAVT
jgi:hypothetical protein